MAEKTITFNADEKFDIQLHQSLIDQRRLAHIFENVDIHKIELKGEDWLWEQTGNIVIEYARDGKPSGIRVCQAGCWTHELKRNGKTLLYLMFPLDGLKELCRDAYRAGHYTKNGGDGGRTSMVRLKLSELLA